MGYEGIPTVEYIVDHSEILKIRVAQLPTPPPHPYIACHFPSFYLYPVWGPSFPHPSPLPYIIVRTKPLHRPLPLYAPTEVLVPISLSLPSFFCGTPPPPNFLTTLRKYHCRT